MATRFKQRPSVYGPKAVAAPRPALAASTFNGIYMRPNLSNAGTVPATGDLSHCPDIWPNGPNPIASFQTALATTQSYQTQSPGYIGLGMNNYIYIRGVNGASTDQSVNVTLYYGASSLLQYPSNWESNIIPTDQGNPSANITNLAPGAIGVADQTFVWQNVQPPPNNSDHYCLIAQFNDAMNSNPIPDPATQLDLSTLICNNLGWGWHNVVLVPWGWSIPTWSYSTGLSVPMNFPDTSEYNVQVKPVGYDGWYVSFQCSQDDANGNPISLAKTLITGSQTEYGTWPTLEPGFNALLTVYMYNDNNVTPAQGAKVPAVMLFPTTSEAEYLEATRRGLVVWTAKRSAVGITPTPAIPLGQVTGIAVTTS